MLLGRQVLKNPRGALSPADLTLGAEAEKFPEKIIQVGEGRFMRGFVDWLINELNRHGYFKGRVVVVAPRPSGSANLAKLTAQDNLYTVWLRGTDRGREVDRKTLVSSISRCVDPYADWKAFLSCAENPQIEILVSNTTEAGLTYVRESYSPGAYLQSYPAKLTAYLYQRFTHFQGDPTRGMVVVPCELVDDNGSKLRDLVIQCARDWNLPTAFATWVTEANYFCNNLVDRIVAGLPPEHERSGLFTELGYRDNFLTVCEPFHLWAIQDEGRLGSRWPFQEIGLNVRYVDDVTPYRVQKVRILNGTHTAMAPIALMCGYATVYDALADDIILSVMRLILLNEIIPTLDMDVNQSKEYADSVLTRFRNPYIKHNLKDIMLNGLSKIRVRLLPTFNGYLRMFGKIPPTLTMAFAVFLLLYQVEQDNCRSSDSHPDLSQLLDIWAKEPEYGLDNTINSLLGLETVWGKDLSRLPGLGDSVTYHVRQIRHSSVKDHLKNIVQVK